MRYFIIGYKSSGKTTLGKKLALHLDMRFIDLDEEIERREGKTIPQLYRDLGDAEFRRRESNTLKDTVKQNDLVVALGGGAPCHCGNMDLMEQYGEVIYLQLETEELVMRLKAATADRPIVLNKTEEELRSYIVELRATCEHFYRRARYIIDAAHDPLGKTLLALGR